METVLAPVLVKLPRRAPARALARPNGQWKSVPNPKGRSFVERRNPSSKGRVRATVRPAGQRAKTREPGEPDRRFSGKSEPIPCSCLCGHLRGRFRGPSQAATVPSKGHFPRTGLDESLDICTGDGPWLMRAPRAVQGRASPLGVFSPRHGRRFGGPFQDGPSQGSKVRALTSHGPWETPRRGRARPLEMACPRRRRAGGSEKRGERPGGGHSPCETP
ncbi:hypothetical protein M885DRAFT_515997 [Pelagophyceae sp. CCMP2097]|nr:hypothetical protein M885DRAFT_515997 [Pelagophyceae sp. CCMP2097]